MAPKRSPKERLSYLEAREAAGKINEGGKARLQELRAKAQRKKEQFKTGGGLTRDNSSAPGAVENLNDLRPMDDMQRKQFIQQVAGKKDYLTGAEMILTDNMNGAGPAKVSEEIVDTNMRPRFPNRGLMGGVTGAVPGAQEPVEANMIPNRGLMGGVMGGAPGTQDPAVAAKYPNRGLMGGAMESAQVPNQYKRPARNYGAGLLGLAQAAKMRG